MALRSHVPMCATWWYGFKNLVRFAGPCYCWGWVLSGVSSLVMFLFLIKVFKIVMCLCDTFGERGKCLELVVT